MYTPPTPSRLGETHLIDDSNVIHASVDYLSSCDKGTFYALCLQLPLIVFSRQCGNRHTSRRCSSTYILFQSSDISR